MLTALLLGMVVVAVVVFGSIMGLLIDD